MSVLRLPQRLDRLGGLNCGLFSHSPRGCKSKINVAAHLVSFNASLLFFFGSSFSLCLHMAFLLCTRITGVSSFSYKDTIPVPKGHILMILFNLNYFLKGPITKYNHIGDLG